MIRISRYTPQDEEEWNHFARQSKQGTFLLDRGYMDYHHDRFRDHSLLAHIDGKPYALLPANEDGHTFLSHQGLTYGGLITQSNATVANICETFRAINQYLKVQGFLRVVYKPIPWIYHHLPAEEDLYAIFKECHAQLKARNIASVVDVTNPIDWKRDRRYGANKAARDGITVAESDDLPTFWSILEANLKRTYGARPTHTLAEISLLRQRFPQAIRLIAAKQAGRMLGATLLYMSPQVAHAQYISASEEGKRRHAIDAIFRHILSQPHKPYRYLDFGTSNENEGKLLNTSLIYQKEGFGGRGIAYDTYEWDIE